MICIGFQNVLRAPLKFGFRVTSNTIKWYRISTAFARPSETHKVRPSLQYTMYYL